MPAQIHIHIFNQGVEKRTIFADEADYATFQGFLRDYLTPPPTDADKIKKAFVVKGRTYKGVPHQPKNYFDQIELAAYCLAPNHFHLILREVLPGTVEKFIRSLATRYSMYFNKKYGRTGPLFAGPYKSVAIKDVDSLSTLTGYLHQDHGISSNEHYQGKQNLAWVKAFKSNKKIDLLSPEAKQLLAGIILEKETEPLERTDLELEGSPDLQRRSKIPQFAVATAAFALLFGLGLKNVWTSSAKTQALAPTPTPAVAGVEDVEEKEDLESKTLLVVKIDDGATFVNIRTRPTTSSEKIGEALEGQTFEFVAINSGWYEVRLEDSSTGFISARYLEILKGETNAQD